MTVRHALLALLSDGPKYGMQLKAEFEAGTGEVWPLNVGQVYMTLQRLERDALVASNSEESDAPQRTYVLTADGEAELVSWLGPPAETRVPPRDELVMKVLVAARVPGIDVMDVVQAHRRWLLVAMQHFTTLKVDAEVDDLSLLLVVDAEIYRLDAAIRWLDSAEERLRNHPSVPDRHGHRDRIAARRQQVALR